MPRTVTCNFGNLLILRKLLMVFPFFAQPNSGLRETLCLTPVTRSRTVGKTPWTGDQLVARPLPLQKHRKAHKHTHTEYACPEWNSNPRVQAPARAKTVHALDRSVIVTGLVNELLRRNSIVLFNIVSSGYYLTFASHFLFSFLSFSTKRHEVDVSLVNGANLKYSEIQQHVIQ
jgi:hypothetical protein